MLPYPFSALTNSDGNGEWFALLPCPLLKHHLVTLGWLPGNSSKKAPDLLLHHPADFKPSLVHTLLFFCSTKSLKVLHFCAVDIFKSERLFFKFCLIVQKNCTDEAEYRRAPNAFCLKQQLARKAATSELLCALLTSVCLFLNINNSLRDVQLRRPRNNEEGRRTFAARGDRYRVWTPPDQVSKRALRE